MDHIIVGPYFIAYFLCQSSPDLAGAYAQLSKSVLLKVICGAMLVHKLLVTGLW